MTFSDFIVSGRCLAGAAFFYKNDPFASFIRRVLKVSFAGFWKISQPNIWKFQMLSFGEAHILKDELSILRLTKQSTSNQNNKMQKTKRNT